MMEMSDALIESERRDAISCIFFCVKPNPAQRKIFGVSLSYVQQMSQCPRNPFLRCRQADLAYRYSALQCARDEWLLLAAIDGEHRYLYRSEQGGNRENLLD